MSAEMDNSGRTENGTEKTDTEMKKIEENFEDFVSIEKVVAKDNTGVDYMKLIGKCDHAFHRSDISRRN